MSSIAEPTGSLEAALSHASSLLKTDPALAARQAQEILKSVPNYPPAILLWAKADFRSGKQNAAMERFASLAQSQTRWAAAHFEYSIVLAEVGRGDEAIAALKQTVKLKPDHPEAWRLLADHLMAIGDITEGGLAYTQHIQASTKHLALQQAAIAMIDDDVPTAERLLESHLKNIPSDVSAIRMLAEVAVLRGKNEAAEKLLLSCLELSSSFSLARYNYAVLLHRRNSAAEALVELEQLIARDPDGPSYRNLYAVVLCQVGEYQQSSTIYEELLDRYPRNAKVWLSYGHVLKAGGRQQDCIDAYRQSITLDPQLGEAYWGLANLETFVFTDADLAAMHQQSADLKLDDVSRLHFHFALGRAYEDVQDFSQSFEQYRKGNALHNDSINYEADLNSARAKRLKLTFSSQFFDQRAGSGCRAHDPIFILGMPRSGSTLLEQILSSHSQVEGTIEFSGIISLAKDLIEQAGGDQQLAYDDVLASKTPAELKQMGEWYLEQTRIHRKTDRPYFIDKTPDNFLHIGLIHLILPNVKIIDARRHPLGCCLSNFKQYYARGQSFSYSLSDLGRFYKDYAELMAHYDQVLPQRVYRVIYERTVTDTESEVRKVLEYCGLPFEHDCLKFFENTRTVRSASSEQGGQPVYQHGVDLGRNYQPWLKPLVRALGPALEQYPDVANF